MYSGYSRQWFFAFYFFQSHPERKFQTSIRIILVSTDLKHVHGIKLADVQHVQIRTPGQIYQKDLGRKSKFYSNIIHLLIQLINE